MKTTTDDTTSMTCNENSKMTMTRTNENSKTAMTGTAGMTEHKQSDAVGL